jgi:2-polyprenyl-3-methyl-5-hydroxy-6-metoxy-1,4-benzoquinol methylase
VKTFSKTPAPNERSRLVSCAVCGTDEARPHWDCGAFSFVRCARCGHLYQNPQPDPGVLLDRYDSEYLDYEVENDQNFLDLMLKGLADVRYFERMATLHTKPSLLDIGCATGTLLAHARDRGYKVQGLEVCEPAARYGIEHRGVPISVGTLRTVDPASEQFTSVHFSHVIEHVPDPRDFLLHVRRLMAPSALGVVVTPNSGGLQARLFKQQWRSAIADHVHLFSRDNLVRLLGETGFTVLAIKTWGGLGAGTAPKWLKAPADRLAKGLGFGDVVLVLFTPTAGVTADTETDHC